MQLDGFVSWIVSGLDLSPILLKKERQTRVGQNGRCIGLLIFVTGVAILQIRRQVVRALLDGCQPTLIVNVDRK